MIEAFSVLIWGRPKTGKSTFMLSFPGPIHIFDFDAGLGPLTAATTDLPEWAEEYPVQVRTYESDSSPTRTVYVHKMRPFSLAPTHHQHRLLLDEFERRYLAILNGRMGAVGTVGIDTASQWWSLIHTVLNEEARQAREEEAFKAAKYRWERSRERSSMPQPVRSQTYVPPEQKDYGLSNAYHERAIGGVKAENINLVLIDRHADVWTTDENGRNPAPSGEIKPLGNGHTDGLVDLVLRSEWVAGQQEPSVMVELSRFRSLRAGMRVPAPEYGVLTSLIGSGRR